VAGWWFSQGTSAYSTNKTDSHDITEILLIAALNTITLALEVNCPFQLLQPAIWFLTKFLNINAVVFTSLFILPVLRFSFLIFQYF
jgi:hypothetical protein